MDYTLLRPFDLEAAKAGGVLIDQEDGAECRYVAGPHPVTKEIVVEFRGQAGFMLGEASDFRMAPLCWVEGRPVYTGDVLYRLDTGAEGSATAAFGTGVVCSEWPERPFSADEITWTPPKVKREIKLVAFLDGGFLRWVREDRWNNAPYARVPSEDKVIEEPAK